MEDVLEQLPPKSHQERIGEISRKFDPIREFWERIYPWVGGIVFGLLCSRIPIDAKGFERVFSDVIPLAIAVAAIFAGLQGAMHAILLSMLKSRAARRLKQRNYWERLIGYVRLGITSLVVFIAFGMIMIVLHAAGKCPEFYVSITSGLIGLFSFSVIASLRIMLLEIKMLAIPDDD